MTSKQIKDILAEKDGQKKLFKLCERHFALVDKWERRLTTDDILNEFELRECQQRLAGCMMKFGCIAGALEAQKEYILQDTLVKEQDKFEKLRVQDNDVAKAKARLASEELGDIVASFRHYFYAAQAGVVSSQSLLKRITAEKSANGIEQ